VYRVRTTLLDWNTSANSAALSPSPSTASSERSTAASGRVTGSWALHSRATWSWSSCCGPRLRARAAW
jgi:hypothetical protein